MPLRSRIAAVAAGSVVVLSIAAVVAQQTPPPPPGGQRQGGAPAGGQRQGGAGFPRVPALPFPAEAKTFDTLAQPIRVVPVVGGLANPWSLAFLPNGDMLVTERPGRLRIIRNGTLDAAADCRRAGCRGRRTRRPARGRAASEVRRERLPLLHLFKER